MLVIDEDTWLKQFSRKKSRYYLKGASQVALWSRTCLPMQKMQETGFDPWVGKIPWRRAWQSTAVFLPGESYGQRRLADYSS